MVRILDNRGGRGQEYEHRVRIGEKSYSYHVPRDEIQRFVSLFLSITAITVGSGGLTQDSETPAWGIFRPPSPIDSGLGDGSVGRNGSKETHRHVAPD